MEKNSNQIIAEVLGILELLDDVDFALYRPESKPLPISAGSRNNQYRSVFTP